MEKINKDLIDQTLQLIQLSSMEEDEKAMWTVLIPSMEETELEKFNQILLKEVQSFSELYKKASQN